MADSNDSKSSIDNEADSYNLSTGGSPQTRLVHAGSYPEKHHGVVATPPYRASTTIFLDAESYLRGDGVGDGTIEFPYGRINNPTLIEAETAFATLEVAEGARLICSGLAAAAMIATCFAKPGHTYWVADNVYGPSRKALGDLCGRFEMECRYFDPTKADELANAMAASKSSGAAGMFLESPGSLSFEFVDVKRIASIAKAHNTPLFFDNSWAAGLLFRPLEHGANLVFHSLSKYVLGHSDHIAGAVAGRGDHWSEFLRFYQRSGHTVSPDSAYMVSRGLRTLRVRYAAAAASTDRIVEFLAGRREVAKLAHPSQPDHPGHDFWKRDFSGTSSLFSMYLRGTKDESIAFINRLKLFKVGAGWGGYESLVAPHRLGPVRSVMSPIQVQDREKIWIRLYIGLEDSSDLIEDVRQALEKLSCIRSAPA